MEYRVRAGQVSYGEAVGIILIENYVPFVPGDVANATTYRYPVRFERVDGLTASRLFAGDTSLIGQVKEAAHSLRAEGVRAITGDCGFMLLYQEELAAGLDVPVFLSSLLQLPFILSTMSKAKKVGVITANAESLSDSLLEKAGVDTEERTRIAVRGLEHAEHFDSAVFREEGVLDTGKMEAEAVEAARSVVREHPETGALLLECSLLPPYAAAVAEETGLPVFDYVTMIDYVFSAVVKRRFTGFM